MIKLARKVLCLDWDKRVLRIVVARVGTGGGIELEDAHAHLIPKNIDNEDAQAFGGYIARQLARHRIKLTRAIVSVPRDRTVLNRLTVPPTPDNELAAAVRFQAMRELPFPLEEARIDFVITARDEQGLATEVLLAAVRNEAFEHLQAVCAAAELVPARVGLRPYGSIVSLTHLPAMLDRSVLFVDVGPAMTEIDVVRDGQLAFSRAANVTVPFRHAAHLVEDAEAPRPDGDEHGHAVEAAAISDLLLEITRTLQAYRATDAEATIDQIVIGGGTGVEEHLLETVEERFDQPATIFDPTAALGVPADDAEKLRGFAAALGLAWGLNKDGALALDFLNPKEPVPPGAVLKRRLRIGAAAAAVVLVGVGAYLVSDYVHNSHELARLQQENAKLKKEVLADTDIDIKYREASEWNTVAQASVWLDHLLWLTQQAIDPGKRMVIAGVEFNAQTATINVKLLCSDWEVANQFAKKLNAFRAPGGRRIYRADQGAWTKTKTVDPKFKLKVDCHIVLLELSQRPDNKTRKRTYSKLKRSI